MVITNVHSNPSGRQHSSMKAPFDEGRKKACQDCSLMNVSEMSDRVFSGICFK